MWRGLGLREGHCFGLSSAGHIPKSAIKYRGPGIGLWMVSTGEFKSSSKMLPQFLPKMINKADVTMRGENPRDTMEANKQRKGHPHS